MSGDKVCTLQYLEVRKWEGDQWPEKRVSLACRESKHAVMISPRYAEIENAILDANEIATRVNYHYRLIEALRAMVDLDQRSGWFSKQQDAAEALLAELEQQP